MNFENLQFERLIADSKNFKLSIDNSYSDSYFEFLKYFEDAKLIEKHHLIISTHFVYGWMPTILKLNLDDLESTLKILNSAKLGKQLDVDELEVLKKCINNSVVGLSKLLHFVNPSNYAIWDSWIVKYITGEKSHYTISKVENYFEYLDRLKVIANDERYNELHSS